MAGTPKIKKTDTEDEYHHIRFRDPDKFEEIRTPDWAEKAASSVSEGAEVRTGKLKDSEDWKVESVLIKKNVDTKKAENKATKIVEKIEE